MPVARTRQALALLFATTALAIALPTGIARAASGVTAHESAQVVVHVIWPSGVVTDGTIDVDADGLGPAGGTLSFGPPAVPPDEVGGGGGNPARIAIAAPPNSVYAVSLPRALAIAGRAIAITGFRSDLPLAGGLVVGHHDLALGGTVRIAPNVPPGRYTAAFDLTVQNN